MTHPIRVGVVGGGTHSAIGPSHIAALRMDGKYKIGPCLFSREESYNRQSHEVYGLDWGGHAANLGEWLEEKIEEIDLVALLTPSPNHAEEISEIAARGISFVTEKPVACSLLEISDIQRTLSANEETEARFVHNYSGYPLFREMVLRVTQHMIGRVHTVRVEMPSDGFARQRITGNPQLWRQSDPEVPMLLLDLGTHMHHLVRMLIGESSARVHARMHNLINTIGVIDNAEIWEERADGILVSYWISKAHLGVKNGLRIEIYGSDGAFVWSQMDPDHLIQVDIDSNRTVVNRGAISTEASTRERFKPGHPTGFIEAFANFYSDLADDLVASQLGDPKNRWIRRIEEAFDGVKFLAAAANSHREKSWIEL